MAEDTRQTPSEAPELPQKPGQLPPGERTSAPSWLAWQSKSSFTKLEDQKAPTVRNETSDVPKTPVKAQQAPVNIMPGGTANTAGGEKIQDYSFWTVLASIRPGEYTNFHKLPCVRDALLTGIAMGFVGGGVGIFAARTVWQSCNFAVFSFLGSSASMHEYCRYNRRKEKDGIRQAVEVMDAKRLAKERKMEEKREQRRAAKREAEDKAIEEEERRRKSWKFW